MPPGDAREKVISAARKALELDPDIPEAHAQLAFAYMQHWQWRDAEAEFRRALELNPNDAAAYGGFGGWLMVQGRMDEALAMSRRAVELDPLGGPAATLAGSCSTPVATTKRLWNCEACWQCNRTMLG